MSDRSDGSGRHERRLLQLESHLRAQYALVVACVAVLALTGLPQKFESLSLSRQVMDLAGGIETLRLVHRVAGGALVLTGVYHVALMLAAVLIFRETAPLRMIPTPRDFGDTVRAIFYFLRLRTEPPSARGREYFQKVDYWFMAWSLAVMAVTGLVNLMPLRAARLLSAETVLSSLRTHSDAAPLVVVWVVIVHLLYTGLTPRLFRGRAFAADAARPLAMTRAAAAPVAGAGAGSAMSVGSTAAHRLDEPQWEDWEGPA
jgi:cytochrome b subunit of formate dehydrogenase